MSAFDWLLVGVQVALLARFLVVLGSALLQARRRGVTARGPTPAVSVIIPAFNEEGTVERCVRALQGLDEPEVIVVDDGSTDGTRAVLRGLQREYAWLRVVEAGVNRGKAGALALGIAASSRPVLVTVDADTEIGPDAVRLLASAVGAPGVGAAACNVKVAGPWNWLRAWQALEYVAALHLDRRAQALWGCITTVPGAAAGWRREAVAQAGGFSADTCTEDMDLTLSLHEAGWRVVFEDRAVAWTLAPATLRALFRQRLRWLWGNLQCLLKHRRAVGRLTPRGAALGWVGLPNAWFVQLGTWLLMPVAVAGALRLSQVLGAWAVPVYGALFALDVGACILAHVLDGSRASWQLPLQRLAFPFFGLAVFGSACARRVAGRSVGWQPMAVPTPSGR